MSLAPLDLSSAVFFGVGFGGPFGTYSDGVIWPGSPPAFPDFYFPSWTLDATTSHVVEITFDPASAHDGGGRRFWLSGVRPGSEETDYDNLTHGEIFADLYDGSGNTLDVVTVTIGPGIAGWNDATYGVAAGYSRVWFESDHTSAISQIRIEGDSVLLPGVRRHGIRPLRQYPRNDGLAGSVPRLWPPAPSVQASNRRGGAYL